MDQEGTKQRRYKDSELVYARYARCSCGAGYAYPKDGAGIDGRGPWAFRGYWDCSDILKGTAIPKGEPGWKTHSEQLPFTFFKVKGEIEGETTRPDVDQELHAEA